MSTRLAAQTENRPQFETDTYTPACVIAYQIADLPAGKFATNNEPVPSVRFLFSDGNETRKWTDWCRISYNEKAKLTKLFKGFKSVAKLMENDDFLDSELWATPMKIFVEDSGSHYTKITGIKPATEKDIDPKEVFYSAEFVPFKYVKAFGHNVPLRLAVLKLPDGIKQMSPDDMLDNPVDVNEAENDKTLAESDIK